MHSNLQHKSPVTNRGQPIGKAPGEAVTLEGKIAGRGVSLMISSWLLETPVF